MEGHRIGWNLKDWQRYERKAKELGQVGGMV